MKNKYSYAKYYVIFINLFVLLILAVGSQAEAATGSTTVAQTLTGGVLSLTSQPAAAMSAATLSGNNQTTTGSLGTITVTDARGNGAGWSLTATTTAFARIAPPVHLTSDAGSLVTAGSYNSNLGGGIYTVTIANGGPLGTATYTVSGLENQAATATGSAVALGTRGLTMTFTNATYVTGDQWTIEVDTIPPSDLTLTPSAASVINGSSSGISSGSAYTYSTGSDPATIMSASSGNGTGTYTNTPTLNLIIPGGSKAGAYAATVTETVS